RGLLAGAETQRQRARNRERLLPRPGALPAAQQLVQRSAANAARQPDGSAVDASGHEAAHVGLAETQQAARRRLVGEREDPQLVIGAGLAAIGAAHGGERCSLDEPARGRALVLHRLSCRKLGVPAPGSAAVVPMAGVSGGAEEERSTYAPTPA